MDNSQESKNQKIQDLISGIQQAAGEIGVLDDNWLVKAPDAEDYDFQIQTGLASASVSILRDNPDLVITWFGYCLISLGYEIDGRLHALIDALRRELEARDLSEENDATDE